MPGLEKSGEAAETREEMRAAVAAAAKDPARLTRIAEGKTKEIYAVSGAPKAVLVRNKDRITAFNAERKDDVADKGRLSNLTNATVLEFLGAAGLRTHFLGRVSETEFAAERCGMIPLEWVTRRLATGSFLKRFPRVPEGTVFAPPKLEICYKDDALGDPVWTHEEILAAKLECGVEGGVKVPIGPSEIAAMSRVTVAVFEILERSWARLGCTLVDMKIEFGVTAEGEIVLADVIDSDSWRLWPKGDKREQLDKQFYRDLTTVTPESLAKLKTNFQHVVDMLEKFKEGPACRVVVLMGSAADEAFGERIRKECGRLGMAAELRVTSAHKGTEETLAAIRAYEREAFLRPTVLVAVAGRSNGLGPVAAGNTTLPVISAPPLRAEWGGEDVWSSLRLPSGLGCPLVMGEEAAALSAAAILAQADHRVFARLKAHRLHHQLKLIHDDRRISRPN